MSPTGTTDPKQIGGKDAPKLPDLPSIPPRDPATVRHIPAPKPEPDPHKSPRK